MTCIHTYIFWMYLCVLLLFILTEYQISLRYLRIIKYQAVHCARTIFLKFRLYLFARRSERITWILPVRFIKNQVARNLLGPRGRFHDSELLRWRTSRPRYQRLLARLAGSSLAHRRLLQRTCESQVTN